MSEWYEDLADEVVGLADMRCKAQCELILGKTKCDPSCMQCRNEMFKAIGKAIGTQARTVVATLDSWDEIWADDKLATEDYVSKWDVAVTHDDAEIDKKLHLQGRIKALIDRGL